MLFCLMIILLQVPLERRILVEEDARAEKPSALLEALRSPNTETQRLAVRAIGRFERALIVSSIQPFLSSLDSGVRLQAVNALGQMNSPFDFNAMLRSERHPAVRAMIYETIGRMREVATGTEEVLVRGLKDEDVLARTGAAKGL